jgi:hypothetical protein
MARDGLTPDLLNRFLRQAEAGERQAQYVVGAAYAEGKGIQQSRSEALKWLHKAAEQGHILAQADLGTLYARGFQGKSAWFFQRNAGVDHTEAYKWFSLALQGGYLPSPKEAALIKQVVPAAELKAAEQRLREVNRHQVANRPFTERLLKFAAQRSESFGETAGRMPWETLEIEVELATVLVTTEIMTGAASEMFGSKFKNEANLIAYIAFALMVLASLTNKLEDEGHKSPNDLPFTVVFGLLDVSNRDEVATVISRAQQFIQQLTGRGDNPSIKQWLDDVAQLPVYYVTDEKTPERRKRESFAAMLRSLVE